MRFLLFYWQFQGFPQPKAIRDGFYRQEIYYGGSPGIVQPQLLQTQPIQRPLISRIESPVLEESPVSPVIRTLQNRQKNVVPVPMTTTTTETPIIKTEVPIIRTTTRPLTTTEPATEEELEEQAKSAYYKFGTSVHDSINDHEHVRSEVREGLALTGMYSYSDGFFRRTVYYKADEDGYRVVKEEIEELSNDGPKFNKNGKADVKSTLAGDYSINIDDFRLNKKQEEAIKKVS